MQIDVLAFGAHPDDVELFCGGLLLKLKKQEYTTGIIDLTRGELGSRGTAEIRAIEANEAGIILNLDIRDNMNFKDGDISVNSESKRKVIDIIRKYRPKIILIPYWEDRHPDHVNASRLVSAACFYSGLTKIDADGEPHRPKTMIYYFHHEIARPSFIVDISNEFNEKITAIQAHKSQFHNPESKEPETYISRPEFLDSIKNRAKYFGFQIGVEYGEPFLVKSAIKINNIMDVFA